MVNHKLAFTPARSQPDLLARPVLQAITMLPDDHNESVLVAEIDPALADGIEFCDRYGFEYSEGANCILVEGTRANQVVHAACVVMPGSRTDLNGFVRRHLGMRRVTLIPKSQAINMTDMEYGSMTAIGLPSDWRVLIDSRIVQAPQIILGSGRVNSKLRLPGWLLREITHGESVNDPFFVK